MRRRNPPLATEIRLRPTYDVQTAHDVLVAFLLKDLPVDLPAEVQLQIHNMASVLCWVLGHEHNPTFAETLAQLERLARVHGYQLRDRVHGDGHA